MAERKAFNFFNSYYQVAKELNDKDRLKFYDALLKRQFHGVEPELDGMAKFAYISQKHSIDSQVEGYENKTGKKLTPSAGGTQGGAEGGMQGPRQQGKEKEKEKEKEKGKGEKAPPEVLEFVRYAQEKKPNVDIDAVKLKYEAWLESGWKTGKGNRIKNWKSTLLNTLSFIPERKDPPKRTQIPLL